MATKKKGFILSTDLEQPTYNIPKKTVVPVQQVKTMTQPSPINMPSKEQLMIPNKTKVDVKPLITPQIKRKVAYGTKGSLPSDIPRVANPFTKLVDTAALSLPSNLVPGYKEMTQQAEKQFPVTSTVAGVGGYFVPGAAGAKMVKPLLTGVKAGVKKNIVEGAVVGTGITAAENVVPLLKGEKTVGQVGKEIATGATLGAVADVGIGAIGKLAKPLINKIQLGKALSLDEKTIVAKTMNVPIKEVDDVIAQIKPKLQEQIIEPLIKHTQSPQVELKPLLDTNIEQPIKTLPRVNVEPTTSINMPKEIKPIIKSEKVAEVLTQMPKKQGVPIKEKIARVYQGAVSSDLPLERIARQNQNVGNLASTLRKVGGSVDYNIETALTDNEGREVGKSLLSIFKDVPETNKKDLFEYALHKHNIKRYEQGKPVFGDTVDANVSQAKLQELANNPQLEAKAKEMNEYINGIMDNWALKSGLVDEKGLAQLREMYPNYVPTYRNKEGVKPIVGGSKGSVPSVIKKAKGGSSDILPLDQQMAMMTNKVIRASRKNELYNSLYDTFENSPDFAQRYFKPIEKVQTDLSEGIDGIADTFEEPIKKVGDTYELSFFRNGEKVKAQISKDLYEAIKPMGELTNVEEVAAFVKKWGTNPFKSLVTQYNPIFIARNIMRDIPTAFIYSNDAIEWSKQMPNALKEIVSDGKAWREYSALGGARSGIFSYDKPTNIKFKGKSDNLAVRGAKGVLNGVETLNNVTETLPRFAEYLATVKKGGGTYESKLEGIMRASEITTDFSRGGKGTKFVDAFVPYLNPSVQGIDKFVRQIKNKPLETALKGGTVITVPTVILDQINKNNKDYKEINEREKSQYYLIPDGKGKFTRIPKSRETGVLFSSLFEWIARRSRGENVKPSDIVNTIKENFTPVNIAENNLFKPAMNTWSQIADPDKDVKNYAGISIVPAALKKYEPKEQYDAYTSEVGKKIGESLNVSPKVIDYIIRSYSGILGQTLLPKTSATQRGILESSFTTDPAFKSKLQNDLYDKLDELTKKQNAIKREGKEDLQLEAKVKSLNKAVRELSAIKKKQKEVDETIKDKTYKDTRMRSLQLEANEIARKILRSVQ